MPILQNSTAQNHDNRRRFRRKDGIFENLLFRACVELDEFRGARIVNMRPDDPVWGGSGGDIWWSEISGPQRLAVGFHVVLGTFGPQKWNKHARASRQWNMNF